MKTYFVVGLFTFACARVLSVLFECWICWKEFSLQSWSALGSATHKHPRKIFNAEKCSFFTSIKNKFHWIEALNKHTEWIIFIQFSIDFELEKKDALLIKTVSSSINNWKKNSPILSSKWFIGKKRMVATSMF